MNEIDVNQQAAETICMGAPQNGKEFHPGDWVALLDGKVVAVSKDLDSALRSLRALDPNPRRGMIFEVGAPVVDVIR
jgi:hypothetical protein